ncbi:MAG: hypothetical protein ACRC35_13740, partial [Angustibacter sp.]
MRAYQKRLRRTRHGRDDGAASVLVLLAIILVSALGVLALGAVLAQVKPTQFQRKNIQTAVAAEAGLEAGLAAIRNATSANPDPTGDPLLGDLAKLPCWIDYRGQVGTPTGADLTWVATIRYFSQDPARQPTTWRDANDVDCRPGSGTSPTTPNFALVTARGVGDPLPGYSSDVGNRTLETVYRFRLTNRNTPGGLIEFNNLCMDAGSGAPAVGTAVLAQTCEPGAARQQWSYRE